MFSQKNPGISPQTYIYSICMGVLTPPRVPQHQTDELEHHHHHHAVRSQIVSIVQARFALPDL